MGDKKLDSKEKVNSEDITIDYKYGFKDPEKFAFKTEKGLNENIIKEISKIKKEPKWMLEIRLKAYQHFKKRQLPKWGQDLSKINFDDIYYYGKPEGNQANKWEDVPEYIKNTFDRLGIPEAEKKFLAGVGAQYESEIVYHNLRKELKKKGVVFLDMDGGLKKHPDLVKKWFGKVVPYADNKFAALNTSVWSGGSFIYVPKNVRIDLPLQAYFRINAKNIGQFERTLIIADEGSYCHYIEGCTAPVYTTDSLHSAVVEIIALPGSTVRYTTIQNWSSNVYNLVTKRAFAYEKARVEWVDGNLGCLSEDTKILTTKGVKKISEITIEDKVFSLSPDFKIIGNKVLAKKYSGKQQVYLLRTKNHRDIKATKNHPFLVLKKENVLNVIKWVPLEEIKVGDKIAICGDLNYKGEEYKINKEIDTKRLVNIPRIPNNTTKEFMWLLGFYLGDGYHDKNRVYFALTDKDRSFKKLTKILDEYGFKYKSKGKVIIINSVYFIKVLKNLGFKGNAKTKSIPNWVFNLPKEQKEELIKGYIDSDGYIRKGHKNMSITSVNKELLEQVKLLSITIGLNPTKISKWTRKEKKPLGKEIKEYTHYSLYFGEQRLNSNVYFSEIISIEKCSTVDTYDIEVENWHNFLAEGIFVHNSKITMKYPAIYLLGEKSHGEVISVAFAGKNQVQDTGAKIIHAAKNTTSQITSKSVSKDGGKTLYRGLLRINDGCKNVKSRVNCDALILDNKSASDTIPYMEIREKEVLIGHEASTGKVSEEQLFYLMSRGLSEEEALAMVVRGFMDSFVRELPMEYALELNRLIKLNMEGSVG